MHLEQVEFSILQQLRTIPEFQAGHCVVHLLLSGGKDSVALLQVLHKLQLLPGSWSQIAFSLVLHHFNHKQRGAESEADEQLCCDLARTTGLPLHVWRWDQELQKISADGANFHAVARAWRYGTVEKFAQQSTTSGQAAWLISTAHHRRDHAETMLLNMSRGCGMNGLTGLSAWSERQRILRPLLWLTSQSCDQYIMSKRLPHREDQSNAAVDYSRNRVRHRVVRELEEINPQTIEHLWQLSQDVSRAQRLQQTHQPYPHTAEFAGDTTALESIHSEDDLRVFLAKNTPAHELNLSRRALSNIYTHVRKCQRSPQEPRLYHFAVSDRLSLRVTNKHLEIKVTRAKFSEPPDLARREL